MTKISIFAFILSLSFNLLAERTYPTTIRCQPAGAFLASDSQFFLNLDLLNNAASISYRTPKKEKNFVTTVEPSRAYADTSSLSMTSSSSATIKDSQIITITGHYQRSTRVLHYSGFSAEFTKTTDNLLLKSLKFNNYNDSFPAGDKNIEINDLNFECSMN